MESEIKTPVEIVQELIAINTTRKEAVDKFKNKQVAEDMGNKLSAAMQQSDQFIAQLMNELSNYGDAVAATADRENEYQLLWKKTLVNMDEMNPQEYGQAFQTLEDSLKKLYQSIAEAKTELPASLAEILNSQAGKL